MAWPADPLERVEVPAEVVRGLLVDQHPDLVELADVELVEAGRGWDNVTYRLGRDLAVRLPVRGVAAVLVANEQRWLPELGPRLPLPTPVPVRIGRPSDRFPWPWSVVPWLAGSPALHTPFADPMAAADALAKFVVAMRAPAPPDAPPNPYRGVPLTERSTQTLDQLASLDDNVPEHRDIDVDAVRRCWLDHVATPPWRGAPQWLHGDLHPSNLLVDQGRLAAVIDFGDLTSGDPATDLFPAWVLFDGAARSRFLELAAAGEDPLRRRGRGWALAMGLAYLANREDHNLLRPLGRRTVETVLADWRADP